MVKDKSVIYVIILAICVMLDHLTSNYNFRWFDLFVAVSLMMLTSKCLEGKKQ